MLCCRNDQEFSLISERHSQEIELYRIQLVNASRTIQELQDKVGAYHSKRFVFTLQNYFYLFHNEKKSLSLQLSFNINI